MVDKVKTNISQKNTMCVGHQYSQANTNNVNETWALLKPTAGKDEPNIIFDLEIATDITTRNSERKDSTKKKKY
jgi:hypothetical protein